MGDVLVETRKWDFGRRDQAADAYCKVFDDPSDRLSGIFRTEAIQWLAALRNVLIHKAGVADREFNKLVRGHPSLSQVQIGDPVPLNGEIALSMLETATSSGLSLLDFARDWLHSHAR
jgi:hypothetical protein